MWRVTWTRTAENQLATIWLDATDRKRVRRAADHIELALVRDPFHDTESREGKLRIMFHSPLAAIFDVDDEHHIVVVTSLWRTR